MTWSIKWDNLRRSECSASLRKQADASRRWQKCDSQKRTQAAEGGSGRQKWWQASTLVPDLPQYTADFYFHLLHYLFWVPLLLLKGMMWFFSRLWPALLFSLLLSILKISRTNAMHRKWRKYLLLNEWMSNSVMQKKGSPVSGQF